MWHPGAAPARPPRPLWPRLAGVAVAIGAQATLYLTLRRIAVATMPAWAHGHAHRPAVATTIPSVVGVALVGGAAAPAGPAEPTIAAPTLQPVPVLPVPPPLLPGSGTDP